MARTSSRSRRWLAVLAVGALTVAACGSSADTSTEAASSETTAAPAAAPASSFPQFTAATIDGGQLEFGSLEGQDTVVWFWAPW